eukprot:1138865-Pelagomonas_calceolata.AAC.5
MSDFAGALEECAGGGTFRDGCGRERKDLSQLAHAAYCHPQCGTELRGAMMLQLELNGLHWWADWKTAI